MGTLLGETEETVSQILSVFSTSAEEPQLKKEYTAGKQSLAPDHLMSSVLHFES